jgi:4-amino-4-deoxy-L-arabinose transferase-like glycosyltransferase
VKRQRDYRFAAVAGLILLVEAVAIIAMTDDQIIGVDGRNYELYARNLIDHGAYSAEAVAPYDPSMYRTPGYPLFLAALRLIGGDSVVIVRIAQFALLGLLAFLVYGIALEIGNRFAARVAAFLCVTYLPFLWLARMHLTETLTAVLVSAAVLLMLQARVRPGPWRHASAGALLAATALVRPVYALAILPIAIAMLIWREGLTFKDVAIRIAALGTAFVLVLVPWTIRNFNLTDDIRPFGVGGGGTSLLASAMQYAGQVGYRWGPEDLGKLDAVEAPLVRQAKRKAAREQSDIPLSIRKEIAADEAARERATEIIDDVSTSKKLGTLPKREAYLWAVTDYAPTSHYGAWHNLARVEQFFLFALTLVGLVAALRRLGIRRLWPVLLFPAYLMVVHLYVHVEGRYSLPVRGVLMALAGVGAAALRRTSPSDLA